MLNYCFYSKNYVLTSVIFVERMRERDFTKIVKPPWSPIDYCICLLVKLRLRPYYMPIYKVLRSLTKFLYNNTRWGRGRSKYLYPLANKMSYYHLKEKSSGHIFKNVTRDRWPVPILRLGILERSTLIIVFVTLTPNEALPSDDSLWKQTLNR